jgi:hypothetical protein
MARAALERVRASLAHVRGGASESDLVDILFNMLRDRDPLVVTNCIQALNEILADEGQARPLSARGARECG